MNSPIFEKPAEREFLLEQLAPDDRRRVRDFMREQSVTTEQAVRMLGIGPPKSSGGANVAAESDDEREFLLSQLSPRERALVEKVLVLHADWAIDRCLELIRAPRH
jgi:hypothetical protein